MVPATSVNPDLMGIVARQITPDVVRGIATQLHEDRGSTASALNAAVPSTLTALSDVASSDTGARHLMDVIDEKRASVASEEDRSLFPAVDRTSADERAAMLIENELGPRAKSIAAAVASASGIKADSAERLMGGVATVAVAALARSSAGMAAGALQSMFREQRSRWVSQLPGPLASLFYGHSRPATAATHRRDYEDHVLTGPAIRELEAPRRNWMIPLILVALALLAIPILRGLRRSPLPASPRRSTAEQPMSSQAPPSATPPVESAPAASPAAAQPAAEAAYAEPGSTEDFASFLGETGEMTPHAFAPRPLNFAFSSAKPTSESINTIDKIAASLKAHPAATIRIESHTDNVGTAESNLGLSQARAESIKNELVDRGVDRARIETAGMGQELPIASNDTPEGRAQNRRSEIVVTAR